MKMTNNLDINPQICHYYFTGDQITSREIHLEYMPSIEQKADFFTEPLEKTLFKKFKNRLGLCNYNAVNQPPCNQQTDL